MVVVPRYAEGGGSNPLLLRREAFDLVDEATGDRGLGPLLEARPELVLEVPVPGRNPDVDTPADLDALQTHTPA
jgi:CTP:molybdopterin cytidylyltransferase MocA